MSSLLGFSAIATVILTLSLGVIMPNSGAGQSTAQVPSTAHLILTSDVITPPDKGGVTWEYSSPQSLKCITPQKPDCTIVCELACLHQDRVVLIDFNQFTAPIFSITVSTSKLPDICQTQTIPANLTLTLEPAETRQIALTDGPVNKTTGLHECGLSESSPSTVWIQ